MVRIHNKKIKILVILLLVSSFVVTHSYAKYVSKLNFSNKVRVAKSGELSLVEKLNGEVQVNNLETISAVYDEIILGNDIEKEVYIEFVDAEVSTYLFLVIDITNWTYDDVLRRLSVLNNKSSLLSFSINSTWSFLEDASSENKLIFYHLVDANNNDNSKYDVMNNIEIGILTPQDEEKINNSSLRFSAYSMQKNDDMSAIEAWNCLNL